MKNNEPIPKYQRKAYEKIWNILQEIEVKRQITSPKNYIRLPYIPSGYNGSKFEIEEVASQRSDIVSKLVFHNALYDLQTKSGIDECMYFKLGPSYTDTFKMYENQYKRASKDHIDAMNIIKKETNDPVYRISYSSITRNIVVNNFLLKRPDFDSENERFFTYVFSNPNKLITVKELNENYIELKKTTHKIIENLGFTGDLKKIFFDVSKTSVKFRNPVTQAVLDDLGIKHIELNY